MTMFFTFMCRAQMRCGARGLVVGQSMVGLCDHERPPFVLFSSQHSTIEGLLYQSSRGQWAKRQHQPFGVCGGRMLVASATSVCLPPLWVSLEWVSRGVVATGTPSPMTLVGVHLPPPWVSLETTPHGLAVVSNTLHSGMEACGCVPPTIAGETENGSAWCGSGQHHHSVQVWTLVVMCLPPSWVSLGMTLHVVATPSPLSLSQASLEMTLHGVPPTIAGESENGST